MAMLKNIIHILMDLQKTPEVSVFAWVRLPRADNLSVGIADIYYILITVGPRLSIKHGTGVCTLLFQKVCQFFLYHVGNKRCVEEESGVGSADVVGRTLSSDLGPGALQLMKVDGLSSNG